MNSAAPKVLVTRPAGRAEALISGLATAGISAVHAPLLDFKFEQHADLKAAVEDLAHGDFDWLVLTSATTVKALQALPEWAQLPAQQEFRAAAVGEKTAAAARAAGLAVELIAEGSAAAILEVFPPNQVGGDGLPQRIFYPVSSAAPAHLETALRLAEYEVQRETAYRPQVQELPAEVLQELQSGGFKAVILTSAMIARTVATLQPASGTKFVAIGQPTAKAARAAGLEISCIAQSADDAALVAATIEALKEGE